MKIRHVVVALACFSGLSRPVAAQDPLTDAKRLYDAASYSEALSVLEKVTPSTDVVETEKYRALCFLAVGKPKEAEQSLERLAMARPLYTLDDTDASPRLLALFNGVRKRVIPEASKQAYQHARASFDSGNMPDASKGFKDVIALADLAPPEQAAVMNELKMLASGFLRLSEAPPSKPSAPPVALQAMVPEPAASTATTTAPAAADAASPATVRQPTAAPRPAPTPPAGAPASATPSAQVGSAPAANAGAASANLPDLELTVFDASEKTVSPPVAIDRAIPAWSRPDALRNFAFQGLLDIIVDEHGYVVAATMLKGINAAYDTQLVSAAKRWRFRPAMQGPRPVRYRLTYPITVDAIRRR